jgi:hypothetical protein
MSEIKIPPKLFPTFIEEENILDPTELSVSKKIMTTMSYSKVKVNGFPNMGCYQYAYHIVREADLLAAYDFDRCMIYNIYKIGGTIDDAFENANSLFETRVLKHFDDNLFTTDYAKNEAHVLHSNALARIHHWRSIRTLIK